jgi:hypothetical protein
VFPASKAALGRLFLSESSKVLRPLASILLLVEVFRTKEPSASRRRVAPGVQGEMLSERVSGCLRCTT